MAITFLLMLTVLRVNAESDRLGTVCDFSSLVLQDCEAVIEDRTFLSATKEIHNVKMELACSENKDCLVIPDNHVLKMSNTNITCTSGSRGIGLRGGSLSMNLVTIDSCTEGIYASSAVSSPLPNLEIINCHFMNNGERAVNIDKASSVVIDGSNFFRNTFRNVSCGEGGAAIRISHAESVEISNSEFNGNTAENKELDIYGGAVYIDDSLSLIISNTTFVNNSVVGGEGSNCFAGGLLLFYTPAILDHVSFISNTATGGYISVAGGLYLDNSNSKFINCQFIDNTAIGSSTSLGGGMYLAMSSSEYISSCHFSDNRAMKGGMMYAYGTQHITLETSTADGNMIDDIYCISSEFYIDEKSAYNITNITQDSGCKIHGIP